MPIEQETGNTGRKNDWPGRVGSALIRLENSVERWAEEDVRLVSFTVSTPYKGRADYLVVGRFEAGTNRYVAFHSAETVYEALKGFCDRMENKTLKLREDQYAD